MGKKDTEKLKQVTKKIISRYSPEKIILFGSRAWGRPKPDSDFDLFVIKRTVLPRRLRQINVRTKIFPPGLPLDILVYTPKEVKDRLAIGDFFIRDIIKKGKTLFAAK